MPIPTAPLRRLLPRQENPCNDKPSLSLGRASGTSSEAKIISYFSTRITIDLAYGESLQAVFLRPQQDPELGLELDWEYLSDTNADGGKRAWAFVNLIEYSQQYNDIRAILEVVSDRGSVRRQLWLSAAGGGLYVGRPGGKCIDCTKFCVHLFADTTAILDPHGLDVTFSLNIVPYDNDEFFRGGEFDENRWCNTLRNQGGSITGTVWFDADEVIPETDILDIHGVLLEEPLPGYHQLKVRCRPSWGSQHYKDLVGIVRIRHLPRDAMMP